ncbi:MULTISPECIES: hypothetical protein [unclassified Microbacterium]|uniref:hypothetical protein n=1 Tax=unclassified Microbacterium TaxID=2609290 RepID=UPI00301A57BE
MGHDKNDELRDERASQEHVRQEERDEAFEATGGTDDLGSQDARRHEGDAQH